MSSFMRIQLQYIHILSVAASSGHTGSAHFCGTEFWISHELSFYIIHFSAPDDSQKCTTIQVLYMQFSCRSEGIVITILSIAFSCSFIGFCIFVNRLPFPSMKRYFRYLNVQSRNEGETIHLSEALSSFCDLHPQCNRRKNGVFSGRRFQRILVYTESEPSPPLHTWCPLSLRKVILPVIRIE
jgi:hypothetical protein